MATSSQGATIIRNNTVSLRGNTSSMRSWATYLGIFIIVISLVAFSYKSGDAASQSTQSSSQAAAAHVPANASVSTDKISVDKLTAANAVTDLAETVNLPTAGDLREATTTLAIKKELSQNDTEVIAKPQITKPTTANARGIKTHIAKQGETIASIAQLYGVTAQTVRWANNTDSDAVELGKQLIVPMTNGVVYNVKDGDTLESVAQKYKVNASRIVLYNDLTQGAPLAKDQRLVLPDGELPENERPGYVAPRRGGRRQNFSNTTRTPAFPSGNYSYARASVGNRYAAGNCTWYAYERRAALGRPIGSFWGNANSWSGSARAAGFVVSRTPVPGAIFQTAAGGGGYGHVGIVERVENGRVFVSDMNFAGYNVVTHRELPNPGSYNYIY